MKIVAVTASFHKFIKKIRVQGMFLKRHYIIGYITKLMWNHNIIIIDYDVVIPYKQTYIND